MVHRRAIIIVFAVGFIVLERYLVRSVSVKPSWQDTKMMEAGAPRQFGGEQIGRAAESRGHLLQTDTPEIGAAVHILKPEGAGRVAEAVIPFGERHGELAGAPAEVAQIPRLHNELQVAQQQIGTQGVEERVMMGEFAFRAGQRDAKVEAKPSMPIRLAQYRNESMAKVTTCVLVKSSVLPQPVVSSSRPVLDF